jgi:hypothetical protein
MDRRQFLKGVGATGALTVGGGALLVSSTQSAVAANFSISNPSSATSDDGSLDFVRMEAAQRVEWDGFDTDVEQARYLDYVTVRPNDDNVTTKINDTTSDPLDQWSGNGDSNGWGGAGEYTSGPGKAGFVRADIDWNIIGDPNASSPSEGGPRSIETPADELDRLEVDTDGATKDSTVVFEKQVRLLDGNGNQIAGPNGPYDAAVSSDSFTVSVTNEEATTSTNGSGTVSVGATDQSP